MFSFFKKRQPKEDNSAVQEQTEFAALRHADYDDIDWLCHQYTAGAKNGHYLMQEDQRGLVNLYDMLIRYNIFIRRVDELRLEAMKGELLILSLKNKNIGYILLHQFVPGSESVEIGQIWIVPEFRNNGYGKLLIESVSQMTPNTELVARCKKASTQAIDMFLKFGFKKDSVSKSGETSTLKKRK